MKVSDFSIRSNVRIAKGVYEMTLEGDSSEITTPGQFVNVALDGLYLRRPISVCDVCEGGLTLVYKVVGKGTDKMSAIREGEMLDLITGLGNGFDVARAGDSPILIGGGVGVPPLYLLAKRIKPKKVVLGFNGKDEVFYEEKFRQLVPDVTVTTVDGSYGVKGFVTDAIEGEYSCFYACGPLAMLKAVSAKLNFNGQVSMEARMGCGFGACMGCTLNTRNGFKRVCKEGPVFDAKEIIW